MTKINVLDKSEDYNPPVYRYSYEPESGCDISQVNKSVNVRHISIEEILAKPAPF